jgi:hypothetical protein
MAYSILTNVDLALNELQNVVIQKLASAPSNVEARIYYDTTLNQIGVYDGTEWVYLGAAGGGGDADTLEGEAGSYYLDRTNHTGAQAISTVTGLQTALDAKAPLASPALTGTPTAPTATAGTNTTQIATTAFVQAATAALIDSAPGTLDTLNELAAALGDDANYAATIAGQIGALDTRIDDLETSEATAAHVYATDVGNGSATEITVTHNLGTRDVTVQVRQAGSPYAYVLADVEAATTNTVTVRFAVAPTSSQYRVIVMG